MRTLHRGLTAANVAIKRRPILAATVITSAKACCADLLIQTCVEGKDTIDKRRALLFGSFGFAYQGCFQYWLYNRVFESMFPGSGLKAAVCKTALSNIIADPCFSFLRDVLSWRVVSWNVLENLLFVAPNHPPTDQPPNQPKPRWACSM